MGRARVAQREMRYKHLVIGAIFVVLISAPLSAAETVESYHLSSLLPGCTLDKRWIGLVQIKPEAMFLTCNGVSMLVTDPNNFVGHVRITTPEQALEFVRFFSNPDTYELFELKGMVELVPGKVTEDSPFNVVDERIFAKSLRRAAVEADKPEPCRPTLELLCGVGFDVTRDVVMPDRKIYRVIERVYESGVYTSTWRKLLHRDAEKLGVYYLFHN
jgi:hypothetical protein